jgi:hypothetical protein
LDWVLCRIYKKSNNFQFSDQEQEGSSTVEEEADSFLPKSEEAAHPTDDHHQFHPHLSMTKSCSLTNLLNNIDYSALSQLLLDAPADEEADPLIYTTPACHQPLHVNNNNNGINTPRVDSSCSDYCGASYSNSRLKRKRIMTTDGCGASTFDDGSSLKNKLQLPSDSRSGAFFGSTGGYCNHQLAEAAASSSFQYGGLLSHPFMNHQQLLLNNHL